MERKSDQERMNSIHSGWEKFKETQKPENISPAFDQNLERTMMEANGIKDATVTESELVEAQTNMIASRVSSFLIEKEGKRQAEEARLNEEKVELKAKRRRFKFYVGAAMLIGLGTAVLFKDQIGGAVKDVVVKAIEYDNQKLEEDYKSTKDFVSDYNFSEKSFEEIVEDGLEDVKKY